MEKTEEWYLNCPWCQASHKQKFQGQFRVCPGCQAPVKPYDEEDENRTPQEIKDSLVPLRGFP